METYARRAPVRARYRDWDRVRADNFFGALRMWALGSGVLLAGLWLVL